jgi:glutamate synthase domain-containing protein 3
MARVCHKNTCPVGVATQDPELRAKFDGTPEMVVNFMVAIAEEVREWLAQLGYRSLDEVIGHPELLRQSVHGREAGFMDLSPLLYVPDTGSARRRVLPKNELPDEANHIGDRIVEQVLASLRANPGAPVRLAHKVRNTQRSVGARLAGQLALRYGDAGLPEGQVQITLTGSGGQSFGAFNINGLHFLLIGEGQDYLGKGMSGGEIVVRPHDEARFVSHQNVILGNTALYGATGGRLFAAGVAGERFAVRNSGATAVVEGAGEHCCEYMTGGTVVVLGETGRNFGAGMTGGQAYVYDIHNTLERRYNSELIAIRRVRGNGDDVALKALVQAHFDKSRSQRARTLLEDWETQRQFFWHIAPHENLRAIEAANEGAAKAEAEEEAVAR